MYFKKADQRGINVLTWTNIFSGLCVLIGSSLILFYFSSFAATMKAMKRSRKRWFLVISKWVYVTLCFPLFMFQIASNAVILINTNKALEAFYFSDATYYGNIAVEFTIYQLDTSYAILGIIIVGFSLFIIFIFSQVGYNAWDKEAGRFKSMFILRVYYLVGALLSVCFFTAVTFFFHYCLVLDTGAWFTNDEFYSNTANIWGLFFNSFFKFFWVLFSVASITVARETNKGESYMSDESSQEDSSSSSKSTRSSRNDASTSMSLAQTDRGNNMDD
jgi:hypothetical protein